VDIPPVAAPLAILVGYVVFAWMHRNPRLAAFGLGLSAAVFVVGGITLTLADKALMQACVPQGGGLESCALTRLGGIVAFRVAPAVGYAAALLVTAVLFRRARRSPL
jgi:hypothetical protein